MHNYGDCLRLYIDNGQFDTFGMLGWWDKTVGSSRAAVSQWIGANAVLGGPAQLYQRAANIWGEWNAWLNWRSGFGSGGISCGAF